MAWPTCDPARWLNRTIVSRYGLVCLVTHASDFSLTCEAFFNGRVWEFPPDEVYLVTRDNEVLAPDGEIIGTITDFRWKPYPPSQRRMLSDTLIRMELCE